MRQTLSKGMAVAAAATGVLSWYGGTALADSHAHGTTQGSPGVLSGNNVQVPVNVPVNICGNSVDAAAALNPAFANSCANVGHAPRPQESTQHPDEYGDSDDSGHSARPSPEDTHTTPPYGSDKPAPSPHGGGETTSPPYGGGETTSPPYGGGETTSPPYGGGETTSPPYGGGETTSPPYGGGETTSPPYGGDETTSPPYGGEETTPPPYGGEETTPPRDDHGTPPEPGRTTPPEGPERPGQPPVLAQTGGNTRTMTAATGAGAVLIGAGTILYRRGRSACRR
ncbi:chaplin family protein [Streptomyces rubradiris]|uniref:chaplin family protein n=1 Tax=Streptomyces rubradiris TaxID=285531 RepID=UPI0036EA0F88